MPEYSDGSGSECSWSIVTNEGEDLVDSDAFSISDHSDITVDDESDVEVHEEEGDNLEEEEEEDNFDSEDGQEDSDDEEVGVVKDNFEVVHEYEGLQDAGARFYANPALIAKSFDELADGKPSKWARNFTVERQVQVLAFSALLATVFMGLVFGNIFTFDQCATYHSPSQESNFGVFKEKERLFSWRDDSNDDLVEEEDILHDLPCDPTPHMKHQLSQCQRNLIDAMKSVSGKAALVRYMRVHNENLKSMLQKLQETEFKSTEAQESGNSRDAPLPSEQLESKEEPCGDVSPLPSNTQTAKPTKERAPEFTSIPCEPKEQTFMNLTRTLFESVVSFANNTSLMLAESKDLAKISQIGKELTRWIGHKAISKIPKTLENARSSMKIVMSNYLDKLDKALELKKLHYLVKVKRTVNRTSSKVEEEQCSSVYVCPASSPLANYLDANDHFKSLLTPKEHKSYITHLNNIPPKQCYGNSSLLGCERCFWTNICTPTKKQCNLRRWQRQKRVNPQEMIASDVALREIFNKLGWTNKTKEANIRMESYLRTKINMKKHNEVKFNRQKSREAKNPGKPRTQHKQRQSTSQNDWFMKRGVQRAALRRRHNSRFSFY